MEVMFEMSGLTRKMNCGKVWKKRWKSMKRAFQTRRKTERRLEKEASNRYVTYIKVDMKTNMSMALYIVNQELHERRELPKSQNYYSKVDKKKNMSITSVMYCVSKQGRSLN